MTEINTTPQAGQQPRQQAARRGGPEPTVASANRLTGLASGLNTQATIETIIQVERRRLQPIENQRAATLQELESFNLINDRLQNLNETADSLKGAAIWEAKIVDSTDEDVVTATATGGAKPGKHTLIVDRLALNHQIASQGYESPDDQVGTGRFIITIGEGSPITVTIDEGANTLTGLKDAINFNTDEANATIIKTGSRDAPYQMVLTSQKTGSEGRIGLEINLQGGIIPNFENAVEEPSPWQGVGEPERPDRLPPLTGTGASTAIVQVIGDYTGEDDNTFTFTAVQTGIVGGDRQLQVRWRDEEGRSGIINLDSLNYAPGEPLEFVDGLALIVSEGEIIVNDSFSFQARAERSDLVWWVPPEERKASVSQPISWSRQRTEEFGAPIIEGTYTGEEDQRYTLTVQGSGQVGRSPDLSVLWQSEEGLSGVLQVGQGYEPGTQLALAEGLLLTLKPGVLNEGQVATFDVTAEDRTGRWWLPDDDRVIPSEILDVTNWTLLEEEEEVVGFMPALPEALGPRVSTTPVTIFGEFDGDEAKVYTFTALRDGAIGTTKGLRIGWDDGLGNSGELNVGETYQPGTSLPFDAGLAVGFGPGRVFEDDTFTVRTRTATVQPPQDALIRFGATELGGGLPITNTTNELADVIDGVRLTLVSTSEKPVTISIRGDTERALEAVQTFVQQFNDLAALLTELTKFDQDKNIVGPLLGNSDVTDIRNTLARLLMDPVAGLPQASKTLFALGIGLNNKGFLDVDESKLQSKIEEDFALVADLFRNKGESDNSSVAFIGMSEETQINTDGYPVDITQPATQGFYRTPPLVAPIAIDTGNNRFVIAVNGRQSEQLELVPGMYTLPDYARALQNAITNDELVGERGVRVTLEGDRIKVVSGRFGSNSTIAILPGVSNAVGVGLVDGEAEQGQDTQGTINGNPAEGTGQLLRAPENSGPAAGLRVFAKITENQLNPDGAEAAIVITKGIGGRVNRYLSSVVNPFTGQMRRITQNLRERVGNLDDQLDRMEERIQSKRQRLQDKFARMESQLSSLRSQQAFMQGQLGGLGASSALPGLPGR